MWKAKKKEDDPSVIALAAFLGRLGTADKKDAKPKVDKKKTASWKYDKTIDSNDYYTKSVNDTNKTYKWCNSPDHGGKGMCWVIYEPGTCTNKAPSFTNNHTETPPINANNMKIDETTIQNLQAILEDSQPGDAITAALLVILQN
jgi:hypothetical protein